MYQGTRDRQCTVQRNDGTTFCEQQSIDGVPFPICAWHALRLFRHMAAALDEADPDLGFTDEDNRRAARYRTQAVIRDDSKVVYYLLVDGLVKIGYSSDVTRRLRAYPPTSLLLGTEPGGSEVEGVRLKQFSHLRVAGREWFTPGPDLRQHIESLADYQAAA